MSTMMIIGLVIAAAGIWYLAGMPTTIEGFTSGIQGIPDRISGLLGGLGGGTGGGDSSANYVSPGMYLPNNNNKGMMMHQQYQYPSPYSQQMNRMMNRNGPIILPGGNRQI